MKTSRQSAFTLIEMLVVISIIAILAAFAVPALTSALTKGQMTGTMNNGRQLYLAAQQMALDGSANSDPTLVWPGDDPTITSVSLFMTRLVQQDYLKPGDVQKLMNGPGTNATITYTAGPPQSVQMGGTIPAFKIFKVQDNDSSNVVFVESNNYTYDTVIDTPPSSTTNPFGSKGFIVQRKGGDASILRKNNASTTSSGQTDAIFQSTVGKKHGDADGTVTAGDGGNLLAYP
jgi:prepilin-type N-terminal cleavage/methylation domain-containing protein